MTVQTPVLYPLKAGEILDRAFRLYRANFWFFMRLTGVLLVPMLILKFLSQYFFQNTAIFELIESFLNMYLLYGALTWAAAQFYLGHDASINAAYQQSQRCFKSLFGANIRQGLAYTPLIILYVWWFSSIRGFSNLIISVICIVVLLGPFFGILATRWSVVIPVIMLESTSGAGGLGRSWSLTAHDIKHSFAIWAASSLLSYLIVSLPSVLIDFVVEYFSLSIDPAYVFSTSLVLKQLGQLISLPLALNIPVILYYDLRVRREGFDLELVLKANETKEDMQGEELKA